MRVYCAIAFICAGIPSLVFMLLAPVELQRYTLCLYGVLCIFILVILGVVVGGTSK